MIHDSLPNKPNNGREVLFFTKQCVDAQTNVQARETNTRRKEEIANKTKLSFSRLLVPSNGWMICHRIRRGDPTENESLGLNGAFQHTDT